MSESASPATDDLAQARAEWAALAGLLASAPRVRVSRDGGKSYRDSGERDLTDELPAQPAAVRTCGADGLVRTLCLDLDTGRGGRELVEADHARLRSWLARHAARWIEDESPGGGRHVYVPLNFGVVFSEAKDFVQALARRFPSLDPGPHENAKTGAIRVPGSVWKRGGHQRLTMDLNTAYDIARTRNPWSAWDSLRTDLAGELAAIRQRRQGVLELLDEAERLPLAGGLRALPAAKEQIARSGAYDPARYNSDSEARQAVLASAAAAGWALTDVQRLMHQHTWAGMTSFYARYRPQHRAVSLRRDWHRAVAWVAANREKTPSEQSRGKSGRKSYTSQPATHPPVLTSLPSRGSAAEYQYLKTWQNALALYERSLWGSRAGLGERMLLRALGEAAAKAGSRFIEFGVRSLALATGTHETTIARQLRSLVAVERPLIRLAGEARGTRGDLYELVIPQAWRDVAETRAWRAGKIHALRPVFRELGIVAAFVYETIETADEPLHSAAVARASGLSPTAVTEAVALMASWHMIERREGGWRIVTGTSLRALAEHFGVLQEISAQLARYRVERVLWHCWLAKRALVGEPILAAVDEDYPFWLADGPPEDEQTMASILQWAS